MPRFDIELQICLGFSHCGVVYNTGYGEVELTEQEVEQLVNLMKEEDSRDIEELDLENKFPEIFKKLDEAYHSLAYDAEEEHWLEEGYYHTECHDYEDGDMIAFLKKKDAWDFEYDEEEFKDEDGKMDEEALFDAECDYLHEYALDHYLGSLHGEERLDFLREQVGISVEVFGCDYEVEIPEEIVKMAFPEE